MENNVRKDENGAISEKKRKLLWMPLDNAAKIYPAARSRSWSNVFRLSATMRDEVDTPCLESALAVTVRRFPSIAAKLCTGLFWYYLEEVEKPPVLMEEASSPTVRMRTRDMKKCALRVLVYGKRIAVEFFHCIADGNSGLTFFKSLLAEYIEQKYRISVPATHGVLDRREAPKKSELEDCFLKYKGRVPASRAQRTAYHLHGTREEDGFVHLVSFTASVAEVKALAKAYGVSINTLLVAALTQACLEIQAEEIKRLKRRRPVKVLVPVDLRRIFDAPDTLRNFVLYVTPEIEAKHGKYEFSELCQLVHHQMAIRATKKELAAAVATNVNSEKSLFIKLTPLFLKNFIMKMVFKAVGERKSCLTFSNLGSVALPEEMREYIERFDFVLSVPAAFPSNASAISFGDTLSVSFVRDIKESTLEAHFHAVLRRLGLKMKVESNADVVK